MDQLPFRIRVMGWEKAAGLSSPIRKQVYIVEQNIPAELEWDGLDDSARHAIAMLDDGPINGPTHGPTSGQVIGCARLLPGGQIGRMAVLASWRRRGIGAGLLQAMEQEAGRLDYPLVFLHAQHQAMPFYTRYNYQAVGENFHEAGIPHIKMQKILSGR